jgi:hypothetical protein
VNLIIIGFIVYVVFFLFIPGISAVLTRRKWVRFRALVQKYSKKNFLTYKNLELNKAYVFLGELESIKTDNLIWLKGETLSISIDLTKRDIFRLYKDGGVEIARWENLTSLLEGAKFYIGGTLEYSRGAPYLRDTEDIPMLVVNYDDEDRNITRELLVKGRYKNELWNSVTPYSYITGVLILIILSYIAYKTNTNKVYSYYILLAAGTPFYFILPPGLIFYLQFRRLWSISFRFSILRDLYNLSGNLFKSMTFRNKSKFFEKSSLLFYLFGYIVNIILAGMILLRVFTLYIFR